MKFQTEKMSAGWLILNWLLISLGLCADFKSLAYGYKLHHQELDEILEVSSTVFIKMYLANIYYFRNRFSFIIFQVAFLSWFRPHADGRTFKLETSRNINWFLKSLDLKIECLLVLDFNYNVAGAQLRKGEASPASFLKIKKTTLILEKKALIVSILGLNLSFKM